MLLLVYVAVIVAGVGAGVGLGRVLLGGFCALAAGFGRTRG